MGEGGGGSEAMLPVSDITHYGNAIPVNTLFHLSGVVYITCQQKPVSEEE